MKKNSLLILVIFTMNLVWSNPITINANQITYCRSQVGSVYGVLENAESDDGGYITFFVRNDDTTQDDSISQVQFWKNGVQQSPAALFVWPETMAPSGQGNNWCFVSAKGSGFPWRENDTIDIRVWTTKGGYAECLSVPLVTRNLRIGNIIPSQDMKTLYIFLYAKKNTSAYTVDMIRINQDSWSVGSQGLQIVGGTAYVAPGNVLIAKVSYNQPLPIGFPMSVRIRAIQHSDNQSIVVGAGVRLVEPIFPIGTWNSTGMDPNNEFGRKRQRQDLMIDLMMGPGNYDYVANSFQEYHMRLLKKANFQDSGSNPPNFAAAIPEIQANAAADYMGAWNLDDEPDMSAKPIPYQVSKNTCYWQNDANTNTHINLCTQKRYNKYSFFSDIVGMDHYVSPFVPNVIPNTWLTRAGKVDEVMEYTEFLKYNAEPRRIWTWTLLADSGWSRQPADYVINYQFWAHIMCGSKGILWYCAKHDTKDNYPAQWSEAKKIMGFFSPIKNLCLYSEVSDTVARSTSNIKSRALISEKNMVVIVLNNQIWFSYDLLQGWKNNVNNTYYYIDFDVPEWIPVQQAYRAIENGNRDFNIGFQALGGRRYRIQPPYGAYKEMHVFVIGQTDTEAPNAPNQLILADYAAPTRFTLSWREPFDNFGVKNYYVYRNGVYYGAVPSPILIIDGQTTAQATWTIYAADAAGNISSSSAPLIIN